MSDPRLFDMFPMSDFSHLTVFRPKKSCFFSSFQIIMFVDSDSSLSIQIEAPNCAPSVALCRHR